MNIIHFNGKRKDKKQLEREISSYRNGMKTNFVFDDVDLSAINFINTFENLYFSTADERAEYCLLVATKSAENLLRYSQLDFKTEFSWRFGQKTRFQYDMQIEIRNANFYNNFVRYFPDKIWVDKEINLFVFRTFVQEFLYHYMGLDDGKLEFLTSIEKARKNAMQSHNLEFIQILKDFGNLKDGEKITFFGVGENVDGCNIGRYKIEKKEEINNSI